MPLLPDKRLVDKGPSLGAYRPSVLSEPLAGMPRNALSLYANDNAQQPEMDPNAPPAEAISPNDMAVTDEQSAATHIGASVDDNAFAAQAGQQTHDVTTDVEYSHEVGGGLGAYKPNYQLEGHTGPTAILASRHLMMNDPEGTLIRPDPAAGDPHEKEDPWYSANNVVNFLFSDEMGLMGMKWDKEGFTWNRDNFIHQLSEHPYSTAFTIGSYAVPVGLAWRRGARIAARAAELGVKGTDLVGQKAAEAVGGRGLVEAVPKIAGSRVAEDATRSAPKLTILGEDAASAAEPKLLGPGENVVRGGPGSEVGFPAETGLSEDFSVPNTDQPPINIGLLEHAPNKPIITPPPLGPAPKLLAERAGARGVSTSAAVAPEGVQYTPFNVSGGGFMGTKLGYKFDEHAALVKNLAFGPANEGRQLFGEATTKLLKEATPDQVAKLVTEDDLRRILTNDLHRETFLKLENLAQRGQLSGTGRMSYNLWKMFGNNYFQAITDLDKPAIENMDKFLSGLGVSKFLSSLPTGLDVAQREHAYRYLAGFADKESSVKKLGAPVTDTLELLRSKWTDLTESQHAEGFIDDATHKMWADIGTGYHLPAVKPGTPGFLDLSATEDSMSLGRANELLRTRTPSVGKLVSSPTMKHRAELTTKEAVEAAIPGLETDPRKLLIGGYMKDQMIFQLHRMFRDVIINGFKGSEKAAGEIVTKDQFNALPEYAKKHWLAWSDLDTADPGLSNRMQRMIGMEAKKQGLDPNIASNYYGVSNRLVRQILGKEPTSAKAQVSSFTKLFNLLTAVHKTASTSLNPPTQMSNIIGNFAFLAMAGVNPFSGQMLKDGKLMSSLFIKLARDKSIPEGETLISSDRLIRHLGDARYTAGVNGENIDIAKFIADPKIRSLIEDQSFESEEGLKSVKKVLAAMENAEEHAVKNGRVQDFSIGDAALRTTAAAIAGVGEVPGIRQTLNAMSNTYLAGDMVPKLMYALDLRRRGWGTDAIIGEVGRRLPQYHNVGNLQKAARRMPLPWITFTAESARIMKNNMMDNPISSMVWMQAPQIAQSLATGMGLGPSFEDVNAPGGIRDAAQPFANRYESVYLNENKAPETLGAVGGGAVGGLAGVVAGGPMGGAAGLLGGAAAGAAFGHYFGKPDQDVHNEFARSWALSWLPQSSLMPTSLSPIEWGQVGLPGFTKVPATGPTAARTAVDLSPVEPFALLMPLIDIARGQGSFGQEVPSSGLMQYGDKMAAGLLGFLMPPMVQKWGLKLEGPEGAIVPMADTFEANGGRLTLPKGVTATLGGLALSSLTAFGTGRLPGIGIGGRVAATAAAGILGTAAGAEINTRRFMTDLGIMGDPRTGQHGDWTLDAMANTFFGVNKSWKVDPTQYWTAVGRDEQEFGKLRGVINMNFQDAVRNGNTGTAKQWASAMYRIMLDQWAPVGGVDSALEHFDEWSGQTSKDLLGGAAMSGLSAEKIQGRRMAFAAMSQERTKMQRQIVAEALAEERRKQLMKARGTRVSKDKE